MFRTLEDGETCISPTLTDKSLQFCFKSGNRKIINSALESLIFIYFGSSTLEYQKYTCLTLSMIPKDPYT